MMALANTASNKVDFCAQYGINITKEMWPSEYLPEILLADRGELEGYNIEHLIDAFYLHVENAAPYRADWKGIVEKQFDTIQKPVRPFLPGYVEKDFQERGARDYRLDAKLTLEQFTQIMIKQVLMYNTKHYLEQYVRDEEMIRDGVEPIPLNLWNWGVENRSGNLRSFLESFVRQYLLPQDMAKVVGQPAVFRGVAKPADRRMVQSRLVCFNCALADARHGR